MVDEVTTGKDWLASKTNWGLLLTVVSLVVGVPVDSAAYYIDLGAQIIGLGLIGWGRLKNDISAINSVFGWKFR